MKEITNRTPNARFPDEVVAAFHRLFHRPPALVVRAPGRVNLLGAHIDYSEGLVMPAAVDRALWLAAAPAAADVATVYALDYGESCTLPLAALPPPLAARPQPAAAGWQDYVAGVAWAIQTTTGLDAVFASDVPIGAGMSSSAALAMAFLLAWDSLMGVTRSGLERARLGERSENGYLGVRSGLMDHFASLHGRRDHLILLDCRHLTHELLPLPPGCAVVVADSGIRRQLQSSGFNNRREECQQAVTLLRPYLPGIRTLRDVTPADLELHAHRLPQPLRRRAQHAVHENARVAAGAEALRQGDLATFGHYMRQSHASSRDLYEVSLPELDLLAAAAWANPGCYGARLAGGGFGGCVTALVREDAAEAVSAAVVAAFTAEFGRAPEVFRCAIADGAEDLPLPPGYGCKNS